MIIFVYLLLYIDDMLIAIKSILLLDILKNDGEF